jgi:hypothetical protein
MTFEKNNFPTVSFLPMGEIYTPDLQGVYVLISLRQ